MTDPLTEEEIRTRGFEPRGDGWYAFDEAAPPDADPYALEPTDWRQLIAEGIPEIDYLDPPYFPKGARIWIWGATGTAKSIWAMGRATEFSRRGLRVTYFSEENPLAEDLRRISLLSPADNFRLFHRTGIDLQDPRWVAAVLRETDGDAATFFDSWTDVWGGDEGDNRSVQQFDASVLKPLQAQGSTPVVIHHTGHPQMFSNRRGATAGRGASTLGQKADVTLEFKGEGDRSFTIVYGKSRIGGDHQPDRTFEITDTDDGISFVEVASAKARAIEEMAERMVQAILTAPKDFLTTTELRAAVGGAGGRQTDALELVAQDERVEANIEKITTADGRLRDARVWRPVRGGLF